MTIIALLSLIVAFSMWHCIFSPTLESMTIKKQRKLRLHERAFKVRVVRAFVPELTDLSADEIEEMYGLDFAYQQVGKIR